MSSVTRLYRMMSGVSRIEVCRRWVMTDDRVRRLLRHQHEVLAQVDAARFGLQQLGDLAAVLEARAGAVPEAVAAAAVALLEEPGDQGSTSTNAEYKRAN